MSTDITDITPTKPMPREEFVKTDRSERKKILGLKTLKERFRLPITLDGCEALLERVTEALDIPLDDTTRQVFCGYVHHLPQLENSTTLDEIGKLLYKNMANHVTWILDQKTKQARAEQLEKARLKLAEEVKDEGSISDTGQTTTANTDSVAPPPQ